MPLALARQRNGQVQDELTWSPDRPRLLDATVSLHAADGTVTDAVSSYLGVRTVGVEHGAFVLNGHPCEVRSVLDQRDWPGSHLTAPSPGALRREVEPILQLSFNACRLHQKIEDPRFPYWADRLGLLVRAEAPGAYEFSPTAVQRLTHEWMAAVDRDVSHPCIVTRVPFNESWGVQQIRHDAVHDHEGDGALLARSYADAAARARITTGTAPSGRPQFVGGAADAGQPVMLTEFGGVNHQPDGARPDGWGCTAAVDGDDWIARIGALYDGVRAGSFLAGSCCTQLTDTAQETNGLLDAQRRPKVAVERVRRAVLGAAASSPGTA